MGQRGKNAAEDIEDDETAMAHHVLDVVAEDPEVQHVPDQVHPASVEEHAGEETHRRWDRGHVRWEGGGSEYDRGDCAEAEDECLAGPRWK